MELQIQDRNLLWATPLKSPSSPSSEPLVKPYHLLSFSHLMVDVFCIREKKNSILDGKDDDVKDGKGEGNEDEEMDKKM